MWETMNSTWLEAREKTFEQIFNAGSASIFEWVKMRSSLSRGTTLGTLLQDEAYHFIRLGTLLERADNTARILDVKYHVLRPHGDEGATDFYQWGALLRSVSAFEVYRKAYRDVITPERVAELLILRMDMPRSLHFCMNGVVKNLDLIANLPVQERSSARPACCTRSCTTPGSRTSSSAACMSMADRFHGSYLHAGRWHQQGFPRADGRGRLTDRAVIRGRRAGWRLPFMKSFCPEQARVHPCCTESRHPPTATTA
jgi:uncharacterized alpha-E superfamily protein